jgi:hypothetical protein
MFGFKRPNSNKKAANQGEGFVAKVSKFVVRLVRVDRYGRRRFKKRIRFSARGQNRTPLERAHFGNFKPMKKIMYFSYSKKKSRKRTRSKV